VIRTTCVLDVSYGTLKGYMKNKARPERSMTEGYAIEEAFGFCTKYL
jgi:hypothetical protein